MPQRIISWIASLTIAAVVLCGFLTGRAHPDEPEIGEQTLAPPEIKDTLPEQLPLESVPLGLPPRPAESAKVELTPERVQLGRRLFFDPILSGDRTLACASCHEPARAFGGRDPIARGIAGQQGTRHAPSLLNVAYGQSFFWDGRAATLEQQALDPIRNPVELGADLEEVLERLRSEPEYRESFAHCYPDGVTAQNLADALASFERVLIDGGSRYDRFQAGEFAALTQEQRQGLWIFESKGNCWRCHSGSNLTDESFHNTGVAWKKTPPDEGRYLVTGREEDHGRFKTPTLRSVARSAPYMHDGSLATLRDVVEFYNRGGVPNPHLDTAMRPLQLSSEEVQQLVAFLECLTGSFLEGIESSEPQEPEKTAPR